MRRAAALSRESRRPPQRCGQALSRGRRHTLTRGRRRALAAAGLLAGTLGLAACGSGTHFADRPKPALQVTLSVYVDNQHVSISPDRVGAGAVLLIITNEASHSQSVSIRSAGGATVASSGTIASGQAAQLPASLDHTGSYEVLTGSGARPANLTITRARANSDRVLLEP
jgi:hypothetical protein